MRIAGELDPRKLGTVQITLLNSWLDHFAAHSSRHKNSGAARTVLGYLARNHGTKPEMVDAVKRFTKPRPRNVVATLAERAKLINAAPDHLRCWILLCSDMAIRSGTACKLTPSNYDPETRMLRFRTKYEGTGALPVTDALAGLLGRCTDPSTPFIAQLSGLKSTYGSLNVQFKKLRKKVGITRQLTPHDLRRTTARAVYEITRDLRTVQALLCHSDLAHTAYYLQNDLTPVPISALETAKLNTITEAIQ